MVKQAIRVADKDALLEEVTGRYSKELGSESEGTTPKTAPSYVVEQKEVSAKMAKYKCSVCGWVYDPEIGDQEGGIAPGTSFEKLPDSWVCPVCGAAKDQFEKVS